MSLLKNTLILTSKDKIDLWKRMGVPAQNYTSAIILNSKIANIYYCNTFITNCNCFYIVLPS
jgi:hypothetical protein